ncbi:MAG: 1-phosphofructokinase family hexose kinase [Acidobacteriaceae bacterium]|nr:1-phosphofructokinase family hexose kinase [Acidobacteriaceae bacterium]MBV9227437.1 1-phosphofructokinase family hexose kinase [Acidobacteriaceae bacterium]MBV9938199.1 1-phosphofructokinase family hexose kinase [Acidobacteriaceae bacterium]
MSKSILTLTVNPALDRIVTVDRIVFEDRAYIESTTEAAGGRGINASRVLTNFGAVNTAVTTSGKEVGRKFEEQLRQDGFGKEIVRIRSNIRTNLTISDRQGLSIKLNELGPTLTKYEQNRVMKAVEALLPVSSWLMLCGSLPPGVDEHIYTKLIQLAEKHGVETLLDTDGDPLLYGLEAKPTIVKPNQSEAERLLNTALITRSQIIDAVRRIKAMGPKSVVLSLGSRGLIAATSSEGVLEVTPPPIEAVSPIGAGDAMSAAIVWALDKGESFSEALRWGVAAGTASTKLPGITLASLDQTKEVYPLTQITRVVV